VILALSTFLAGLYFGKSIPEGVNLLMLQVGLVGIVGALGLANLSAVRHMRHIENSEECQVEERLVRHTSETQLHSHDGSLSNC